MPRPSTMHDVVRQAIARESAREAVVCGEVRETYAEWGRRAESVAAALRALGLAEGERLGTLFRNGAHASECVAVAALGGWVYVPVNHFLTVPEIVHIVRLTGMRALIHHPAFADTVRQVRERCPSLAVVIPLEDPEPGALSYERLAAAGRAATRPPTRAADDPFLILFTSGTTGRPKGVTLSHENIIVNAEIFVRELEIEPDSRGLVVAPHFFSAAINCTNIPFMLAGGTVVFAEGFSAPRFLETVARERVSHAQMVPTMVIRLLDCPDIGRHPLTSLRTLSYGSAPMPVSRLREAIATFGPVFYQTYGMTECPQIMMALQKRDHLLSDDATARHRLASCGRALADGAIRIVDDAGRDVPDGEQGELLLKGRSVMLGYWDNPDETAQALRDGWMRSGDIGWRDADGYITIVGRKKEIIISGGIKIAPAEVESAIFSHPAVADAVVAGVPHPEWGEMVKAFVVLKPDQTLTEAELIRHCGERLASYKKPKAVAFVASLPKTSTGKPIRRGLT